MGSNFQGTALRLCLPEIHLLTVWLEGTKPLDDLLFQPHMRTHQTHPEQNHVCLHFPELGGSRETKVTSLSHLINTPADLLFICSPSGSISAVNSPASISFCVQRFLHSHKHKSWVRELCCGALTSPTPVTAPKPHHDASGGGLAANPRPLQSSSQAACGLTDPGPRQSEGG